MDIIARTLTNVLPTMEDAVLVFPARILEDLINAETVHKALKGMARHVLWQQI